MVTVPTLKLVCESKIRDLMPRDQPTKRLEASGDKGRKPGGGRVQVFEKKKKKRWKHSDRSG